MSKQNEMAQAFAEGVKQALSVFTGDKSPPRAAQDLIKALEKAAAEAAKKGPSR
ncbi:MAG: hypothetical protein OHK0013_01750 [Sandaracinaceae bacterium]